MTMIKGIEIDFSARTTQLDAAFRKLNAEAKVAQSELRGINTLLKMSPKSPALAAQKTQLLAKSVKDAELKQRQLNTALKQAQASGVDRTSAAYRKLERELVLTNAKLKALKKEQLEWLASQSRIGKMSTALQGFGSKASAAANKMKYLSLAAAGIGVAALKVTMNFDEGMSKVQAITGATGDELNSLRNKAKQLGASTKFSATEATEAMNYMAMAGWKTEDMLSGLDGVMNLAAASGEDLATTSDIVTDALTAFGLKAEDSTHFADVLAAASANANTNVKMMGETFKYAAPIAGSLGYNIEDVAESIGLMGNAGIKSSQAGTSLRRIMTSLNKDFKISSKRLGETTIKTTKADGSMRSWGDIIKDTRAAFKDLTASEKATAAESLVGKNAMSGFLAIMNASPKDIKKLEDALGNADGAAKSMADTMLDNTKGSITILKSTLESAGISIGETLAPMLTKVVEGIKDLVSKFNDLSPATKDMIAKMVLFTAAGYPALKMVGGMATGLGALLKPVSLLVTKIGAASGKTLTFGSLISKIPGPAMLAVGAVGALAAAIKIHENRIHGATKAYQEGKKIREENIANAQAEASGADHLKDRLDELMAVEDKSVGQKATIKAIVEELNEKVSGLNLSYNEEKDALNQTSDAIENKIEKMKQEAEVAAYQQAITDAFKARLDAEKKLEEAEANLAAAREKYQNLKDNPNANEEEIQGAAENVKAMQAAYDDAATAVADCDEEIDKYNNKIIKAKDNTAKTSKSIYYGSTQFAKLKKEAGAVGYQFSNRLVKGFESGRIKVPATVQAMKNAIKWDDMLAKARRAGYTVPDRVSNGIISGKYKVPESVKEVQALIKWDRLVQRAKNAGMRVPTGLAREVRKGGSHVSTAADKLRQRINAKLDSAAENARGKGSKATRRTASGLQDKKAMRSLGDAAEKVGNKIETGVDVDSSSLGADITEGIAAGMTGANPLSILGGAITSIRNFVVDNANKKFKRNSPAKVMYPLGEGITEGVAAGMDKGLGFIDTAGAHLLQAATGLQPPGSGAVPGGTMIGAGPGGGSIITNNITVSGATNPEEYAARLAREIKLQLRTV